MIVNTAEQSKRVLAFGAEQRATFVTILAEGEEGSFELSFFSRPSDALKAALSAMASPAGEKVARAIHMVSVPSGGEAEQAVRWEIEMVAALGGLAAGGQILMSHGAFDSARPILRGAGANLLWMNHGRFLFRQSGEWLEICEVALEQEAGGEPLKGNGDFRRQENFQEETVGAWRPGVGEKVPGTEWELVERLGEGGFGEVWLAGEGSERRVFKFCFRPERVRSLRREASVFQVLKEKLGQHEGIVSLLDFQFERPPFYLAVEYVAGGDLKTWSERAGGLEAIPLRARVKLVGRIARALEAAHSAGILHRDIKPGNVLVVKAGAGGGEVEVKLADFGIGQVISTETSNIPGFTQTLISAESKFQSGTFLYMAPEIIAGGTASAQSDIYSLGLVLFQLALGKFNETPSADWESDLGEPRLAGLLRRCLAGDPGRRFGSARELAEALEGFGVEERRAELARRGFGWTHRLGVAALIFVAVSLHQTSKGKLEKLKLEGEALARAIPVRAEKLPEGLLDLTAYYNMDLLETLADGAPAGNNYAALGPGLHRLGGTHYDVRGLVQMRGFDNRWAAQILVPVNQRGSRIHFLHAARYGNAPETKPDQIIATYRIYLKNGDYTDLPIRIGKDVNDWHVSPEQTNGMPRVVWSGENRVSAENDRLIALYETVWENPRPETEISAIRCLSARAAPALFIAGITVIPLAE